VTRVARAALCALVTVWCAGCGGTKEDALPDLRPVPLPDISNASPQVQEKLRSQHAAMTATVGRAGTPRGELASAYGEMGRLFTAAEYYDAAAACFENARALAPGDHRWPFFLGHVFRLKSDPATAQSWFERALAIVPDDVPTLVWLAEMQLAQGKADAAAPLLARAQSLQPQSGAVLYGLGRVALARNDYARAAEQLEAALASAPHATRVHYPLALAYRGLNRRDKADQHAQLRGEVDLLPADPLLEGLADLLQNASAHEVRGSQAMGEQRWDDAIASLQQAVALAPGNAFSRLNLATSYYMKGDAPNALEHYREAVRLSPGLARAHFGIGVIFQDAGRLDEAIAAFAEAVRRDGTYAEARFSLANALRRTGRVEEALPHYEEVLRANPSVSQASFGYAMGLVRLGRYRDARASLEASARTFQEQRGFAHALARVLAAAPDAALRDGARALAIVDVLLKTEQTPALFETRAMALAEVGRFDEAVATQDKAIAAAKSGGRAEAVPYMTANLRLYRNRQPCRMPWADDDPVHR
jgi:tetratricopeptide (TPR) repeat protein